MAPVSLGSPSPALLAVSVGNVFEVLGVAAAFWDGTTWRAIHSHGRDQVVWFEVEHGVEAEREKYNVRCMERANHGEVVLGEHGGLSDLFVPLFDGDRVMAVLATGPFATARPTSASILKRWHWLTGRTGHPSDPEFMQFLTASLATLVLEGSHVQAFERLVVLLARLIAGQQPVPPDKVDALRLKMEEARHVERIWEAARSMIDERTRLSWSSSYRQPWTYGLKRVPDHALVGLVVSRDPKPDAVDDLLRRDAFQRASVRLATKAGSCVAGKVGDHGVMLLSAGAGSTARKRQRLLDLADTLSASARAFGFRLHLGLDAVPGRASPAVSYEAALAAAESALARGARLVDTSRDSGHERPRPSAVVEDLVTLVVENPSAVPARFDQYLETVGLRTGYRLEPTRGMLEAAFERLCSTLLDTGALDAKSLQDLTSELERSAIASSTALDLFATYRRAVADLCRAMQRPAEMRKDRSLRRALTYIERHYTEPLTLARVARVAGYAPAHFSVLFKAREKMTFEHYLRHLRIERAKLLLGTYELDVQTVGRLAGFRERHYFSHVFKKVVGMTPVEYRFARPPPPP